MTRAEKIQAVNKSSPEPQFLGSGRNDNGEKTVTYLMTDPWQTYLHYGPEGPTIHRIPSLTYRSPVASIEKWRDDRMREFNTDYFEWTLSTNSDALRNSGIDIARASNYGLEVVTFKLEHLRFIRKVSA